MYFILFTSCKVVIGYKQSLIYDLQNCLYLKLPNELAYLLQEHNYKIKLDSLDSETNIAINSFCQNLVENNFGFFYEHPEEFINLPLNYETPSLIKNAVIIFNDQNDYSYFFKELNVLGGETISIVIKDNINFESLEANLKYLQTSDLLFIEIICFCKVSEEIIEKCKLLSEKNNLLKRAIFYQYGESEVNDSISEYFSIFFKTINKEKKFNPINEFAINYPFYIETQEHNIYFNQKIFIDEELNIHNHINLF